MKVDKKNFGRDRRVMNGWTVNTFRYAVHQRTGGAHRVILLAAQQQQQQRKKSTAVIGRHNKGWCERRKKPVKGLALSGMWRLHLYGQIPPGAWIGPAQTQQVTARSSHKKKRWYENWTSKQDKRERIEARSSAYGRHTIKRKRKKKRSLRKKNPVATSPPTHTRNIHTHTHTRTQ